MQTFPNAALLLPQRFATPYHWRGWLYALLILLGTVIAGFSPHNQGTDPPSFWWWVGCIIGYAGGVLLIGCWIRYWYRNHDLLERIINAPEPSPAAFRATVTGFASDRKPTSDLIEQLWNERSRRQTAAAVHYQKMHKHDDVWNVIFIVMALNDLLGRRS